jgi:pilus assembly protein Flp/PilA
MLTKLMSLFTSEQGQGTTESGLVLGVIAVGIFGIILGLKLEINNLFDKSVQAIENAARSVGLIN